MPPDATSATGGGRYVWIEIALQPRLNPCIGRERIRVEDKLLQIVPAVAVTIHQRIRRVGRIEPDALLPQIRQKVVIPVCKRRRDRNCRGALMHWRLPLTARKSGHGLEL